MAEAAEKAVEAAQTETPTSVDDIVFPEADLKKLDDALEGGKEKEISSEAESVETESDDEKDKTEEKDETDEDRELEEESTFAIDVEGKEKFTTEQIKKWREDSKDVDAFIASTREKTKELSESRKALKPVIELVKKFKDAGEKKSEITEYLIEELGISKEALDAAMAFEEGKFEDPLKEELATEKDARAKSDIKLVMLKDRIDFAKLHKISMKKVEEVEKYALKMNIDDPGQIVTLGTAYNEMRFPEMEEELKKLKAKPDVKISKLPDKTKGAADIKAKKAETFDDASYDEALKKDPNYQKLEGQLGR